MPMAQGINGHLHRWQRGEYMTAEQLNGNFAYVADTAQRAIDTALRPDPAAVGLEAELARLGTRVDLLESLTAMHERQRNEREWAPLSHVGALITLITEAQAKFEAAVERIEEAQRIASIEHSDQARRLSRLEQQPDFATHEEYAALVADHERLALKEHMLLAQIHGLRHEVGILRKLALGHDRLANRMEYAPLSYFGNLLQRVMALEEARGA